MDRRSPAEKFLAEKLPELSLEDIACDYSLRARELMLDRALLRETQHQEMVKRALSHLRNVA